MNRLSKFILFLFLVLGIQETALSSENLTSSDSLEKQRIMALTQRLENIASTMELTLEQYLKAAARWERLKSGDAKHNIPNIFDTSVYQQAVIEMRNGEYASTKMQEDILALINNQKAKLANYLGIEISKLDLFIQKYEQLSDEVKRNLPSTHPEKLSTTLFDTEKIIVHCRDFCNANKNFQGYQLDLVISDRAQNHNISQYSNFLVEFRDYQTNALLKKELWARSNFSGAWFKEKFSCDTCEPY